ncbi:hypothetical protein DFH28DRAFT_926117 [Melampsora americana]|nr:hypothetical protein DFH28DRAFT_926117 [Melampsora americana]
MKNESRMKLPLMCLVLSGLVYQVVSVGKFIRCCDANQGPKQQLGCVGENFRVAECLGKSVELSCEKVNFLGNQAKCPNDSRQFPFATKSRCQGTKTPRCVDISGSNDIKDSPVKQGGIGKFIRCCDANQGIKRQLGCEGGSFTEAICGGKSVQLTCTGVKFLGNQARCPNDNRQFPFPQSSRCKVLKMLWVNRRPGACGQHGSIGIRDTNPVILNFSHVKDQTESFAATYLCVLLFRRTF